MVSPNPNAARIAVAINAGWADLVTSLRCRNWDGQLKGQVLQTMIYCARDLNDADRHDGSGNKFNGLEAPNLVSIF